MLNLRRRPAETDNERRRRKWETIKREMPEFAAFILAAKQAGLEPQEPEITEL